jgi:hypothetical protein
VRTKEGEVDATVSVSGPPSQIHLHKILVTCTRQQSILLWTR